MSICPPGWVVSVIVCAMGPLPGLLAGPVGTALTYQGQLKLDGANVDDVCDCRFSLWDDPAGGTQIGPTLTFNGQPGNPPPLTISDGLFSVELDFGAGPFTGNARWLEIAVACPSGEALITLSPRQPITPAPYAVYALKTAGACLATIADLRDSPIPGSPLGGVACVRVLGYHAPGDGGGGEFRWDAMAAEPDDGGLVIAPEADPSAGRWKRVFSGPVHIAWWGPAGDGVSDDTQAVQRAFDAAAGRGISFSAPRTYGFHPALSIPADTRIENNGAGLRLLSDPGGASLAVTVGDRVSADLLKINVAPGVQVRRLILLGDENVIDRIEISAAERQSTIGSNLDGALQIRSQNVRLGEVAVSNFDLPALAYLAEHLVIERLRIRDYIFGLKVRECNFVELLSGEITTPSPGAMAEPGHNGLLFETSNDVVVSDMVVHDAGEHGIRIGGAGDSSRFVFNNIQAIRPGKCGLKINPALGVRVRDVQINGLTVVDAAATSAPNVNEDGIRLEKCSYVTINGFQVEARDRAASCHVGLYINACDFVTINGPRITNAASSGIHLQDREGTVNEIFINNPAILFTSEHGIYIDSGTEILRDITVMNCYIRGQGGWGIRVRANTATVGVNQPVILHGWIKNDGLGGVSISTTDMDVHNHITVVN